MNLDQRIAVLEAARRREPDELRLLAPRGILSPEQHTAVAAARAAGRQVMVIELVSGMR